MDTSIRIVEDYPEETAESFEDDSDVPIDVIISFVVSGQLKEGVNVWEGGLRSAMAIKAVDYKEERPSWAEPSNDGGDAHCAPGKRKVIVNKMYNQFWAHWMDALHTSIQPSPRSL